MNILPSSIISETASFVRSSLQGAESAHGWWHVERVWRNACALQEVEGGDRLTIELAALLHDIADYKLHGGDTEKGPKVAGAWLSSCGAAPELIKNVQAIIAGVNYKGPKGEESALSLEHAIVQDADRLDAMGAIGIARAFAFGGHFGRDPFDPSDLPRLEMSVQEYKKSKSSSINHFFEKLFKLKARMLTKTGRELATERHQTMVTYMDAFLSEWFGKGAVPAEWRALLSAVTGD